MSAQLKVYGGLFVAVVLIGGNAMYEKAKNLKENYTVVDAQIIQVDVDCYIKDGKNKVVRKGSTELFYMDCTLAPFVAAKYDMHERYIYKRAQITYRYRSPVDNRRYTGNYTRKGQVDRYVPGKDIQVHAHNLDAEVSVVKSGNIFIEDTGV